jgi:hypothetical protein
MGANRITSSGPVGPLGPAHRAVKGPIYKCFAPVIAITRLQVLRAFFESHCIGAADLPLNPSVLQG